MPPTGAGNCNHHLSLPDSGWLRLLVTIFWGLNSHQNITAFPYDTDLSQMQHSAEIQQVQSTKLNTTQPSRQSQSTKNCLVAALMHPLEGPSRQKTEKSVFRRLGTSKGPVDKKRKNRFFVDWETPKAQWYNQPLPSIARWAGCWYFCVRVHLA